MPLCGRFTVGGRVHTAIVTTGHKYSLASVAEARRIAEKFALPCLARENLSEEELREGTGAEFIFLVKKSGLALSTPAGEFYFHPNMAHLRVKNIRKGEVDHMGAAMGLGEGKTVLDCTLGLGADAIVAAYLVGEGGRVVGVEGNPLVAEIVARGLERYRCENLAFIEAMRRIEVFAGDSLDFLRAQETRSFDIVYFDPMFRYPLRESVNLSPLRHTADARPVSTEMLREARRVAKERVVLKENSRSEEFARLGFSEIVGGRYSPVHYGVMKMI